MFDPTIGQFISDDPIEFDAGDPNLRRFVGNSPTNATDPTGLRECDDRLTTRTQNLVDVSSILDAHVNEVIGRAWDHAAGVVRMAEFKRDKGLDPYLDYGKLLHFEAIDLCRAVYAELGENEPGSGVDVTGLGPFNGSYSPVAKIGVWLDSERNLSAANDQIVKLTFSQSRYHLNDRGYLAAKRFKWLYSDETADHGIAGTINVNGILMGTDKWEHFFQQGYWYFDYAWHQDTVMGDPKVRTGFGKWLEGEADVSTAMYAGRYMEIAKRFGEARARMGIYGSYSTGIISNADMAANEQGFTFYLDLYRAFMANPTGKVFRFSAKKYTTTNMNEQKNPSIIDRHLKIDDSLDALAPAATPTAPPPPPAPIVPQPPRDWRPRGPHAAWLY
jgi:hypothetical protein